MIIPFVSQSQKYDFPATSRTSSFPKPQRTPPLPLAHPFPAFRKRQNNSSSKWTSTSHTLRELRVDRIFTWLPTTGAAQSTVTVSPKVILLNSAQGMLSTSTSKPNKSAGAPPQLVRGTTRTAATDTACGSVTAHHERGPQRNSAQLSSSSSAQLRTIQPNSTSPTSTSLSSAQLN